MVFNGNLPQSKSETRTSARTSQQDVFAPGRIATALESKLYFVISICQMARHVKVLLAKQNARRDEAARRTTGVE